jgi:hypothetical protein
MQMRLFAASNLMGLFFAYIDSRPNWDDAGVLVGQIFLASAILGSLGPRRPWLWALAISVWMPLQESLTTHRPRSRSSSRWPAHILALGSVGSPHRPPEGAAARRIAVAGDPNIDPRAPNASRGVLARRSFERSRHDHRAGRHIHHSRGLCPTSDNHSYVRFGRGFARENTI